MVSKYILAAAMMLCALGGWWMWHQEDADFMEAGVGAMAFFCCLFCALGTLAFAPNFLTFG